jgi:integrase
MLAYRPGPGRRRIVETASPDPAATQERAKELSRRLEQVRLGTLSPDDVPVRDLKVNGLTRHLRDFHTWLASRGRTPKHAGEVHARAKRVMEWCGFQRPDDVNALAVQAAVNKWREEKGRSAESANKHLKAARRFSRWLWRNRRLGEHRLEDLEMFNVEADRRHVRRDLTAEELAKLLAAAASGRRYTKDGGSMDGPDRRILYVLAANTGFRRSELASLTRASFDLQPGEGREPTVTVEAAHSKHRRRDVLPLRPDVAADLRAWLAGRPADGPVFAVPDKAFIMLYQDLAAAGVTVETPEGVADFHALRHTFITMLGRW